jgi:tripartite-type tricarboxylate transporter receptor subunit TctC
VLVARAGPRPHGAADSYPNRPVRGIVPFTPGAGTDTTASLLAQRLSGRLGPAPLTDFIELAGCAAVTVAVRL